MAGQAANTVSRVEQFFLDRSHDKLIYPPTEKIGCIVVDNFPLLGKLTALRFLEWAQQNPDGVVSLPTGKSPEFFIKFVTHYLGSWSRKATRRDLDEHGVDCSRRPDFKGLRFVQIDEFYPIDPSHHNSFHHYVNKFYIEGLGFDRRKALLISCAEIGIPRGMSLEELWGDNGVDLSLRFSQATSKHQRQQKAVLEAIDQWCYEYEEKIRSLGGIGFFLGGIGPDGHIAFNVRGSDHNSTTRLTPVNYETQAASASDLGGVEVARKRLAITIGLSTIRRRADCTAIIMAAGASKATVVREAIECDAHVRYPATALHGMPNARFYVTEGAARFLVERRFAALSAAKSVDERTAERVVVDIACGQGGRVADLSKKHLAADRFGAEVLKKTGREPRELVRAVEQSLAEKVAAGMHVRENTVFLHTAPHHDDIMLGYLPFAVRHIRTATNRHTFAYMTSGFTAVTNAYALSHLSKLKHFLKRPAFERLLKEDYFKPGNVVGRNRDVWQYLDGVAANSATLKSEGEARRRLRNLIEVFEEEDVGNLGHRIDELVSYFGTQYPGKKDLPYIQELKGRIREWEADCLWGYLGFDSTSVRHLRLGFYGGEIFTEEPTVERDVQPVLDLVREVKPDVVTVALDPEGSGPDTHYKVLQAVAEALVRYEKESGRSDVEILGYRNVWYRFHPAECNLYVPVSLNMFAVMQNAFLNAFVSQKSASFPSHELDGPFSHLAQKIQVQQYQMIKTCLGRSFFYEHQSPLIRATRGLVFLRTLSVDEFYRHARALKEKAGG